MGEIIFQTKHQYDKATNFVWGRLKAINDSHLVIYSPCPKVSKDAKGFVIDVLPYDDLVYCPVANLRKSVFHNLLNPIFIVQL